MSEEYNFSSYSETEEGLIAEIKQLRKENKKLKAGVNAIATFIRTKRTKLLAYEQADKREKPESAVRMMIVRRDLRAVLKEMSRVGLIMLEEGE